MVVPLGHWSSSEHMAKMSLGWSRMSLIRKISASPSMNTICARTQTHTASGYRSNSSAVINL